jgi:hypothetical protein
LLACRWTAENSRGPSNSKVISSGCPPKELLSQPTHLLPARTTEAQTSAAVQYHSNRRSYTNIMLQYCKFSKVYCIHDVWGVGCTPVSLLLVLSIFIYLLSFHFEIRSKYWHLIYDILKSAFDALQVACWPLVPKFAGSHPAEAVGFFRA